MSVIYSTQDSFDMTVIPGEISRYICRTEVALKPKDFLSWKPQPPASPIWVAPLNRSISLTPKSLSHLYDNHILGFKTKYDPLLQFLKKESFEYEETGNTRTVLFFDQYTDNLVAFCSTKCSSLKSSADKIQSLYPAIEIAALCVDDRFRYLGVGHSIFNHVIQQVYNIKTWTGVQLVTLFAIPDAVAFYQKLHFRKLSKGMKVLCSPAHYVCTPMYLPLANIDVETK